MKRQRLVLAAVSALTLLGVTGAGNPTSAATDSADAATTAGRHGGDTVVVGHRGASGYRPEHTLASYELAARMGADYIEPDLVTTSDGVLVARHEPEIGGTTDVADHPEFADRRTTKLLDGTEVTGWFAEDFTLAELKTLRAKERIPDVRPNNTVYDGRFEIPTFQEVIDLSKRLTRELHRPIGIFPETKHPTYFADAGLALEPKLVAALNRNGLNRRGAHVYVQSFEVGNLKELSNELRVPLVQLTDASGAPYDLVASGDPRTYADLTTPEGLAEIATYAQGLGPSLNQIIPLDENGDSAEPTSIVDDAHDAGLTVIPWTFRAENEFLPGDYDSADSADSADSTDSTDSADPAAWGDIFGWYEAILATGVDGVFADQPDLAVEATEDRGRP